jgi:hypothetical protein
LASGERESGMESGGAENPIVPTTEAEASNTADPAMEAEKDKKAMGAN